MGRDLFRVPTFVLLNLLLQVGEEYRTRKRPQTRLRSRGRSICFYYDRWICHALFWRIIELNVPRTCCFLFQGLVIDIADNAPATCYASLDEADVAAFKLYSAATGYIDVGGLAIDVR